MKRFALVIMLLFGAHSAHAQQHSLTVDKKLANAGKQLFTAKGCGACHTIGKGMLIGPDLNGLFSRRSADWVERWLHDPPAMLAADSTAKALRKNFTVDMPNLGLSRDEILALMNYLAAQSKAAEK